MIIQCFCGSHLSLSIFSGKLERELRGDLVLKFKELLKKCYKGLPVVFVQFGKISRREGMFGGCDVNLIYDAHFCFVVFFGYIIFFIFHG